VTDDAHDGRQCGETPEPSPPVHKRRDRPKQARNRRKTIRRPSRSPSLASSPLVSENIRRPQTSASQGDGQPTLLNAGDDGEPMTKPNSFGFTLGGRSSVFYMHPPFGTSLEQRGLHEPATTMMLLNVLRNGDVFIDVGANVGYFSLIANGWMNGTGRIIAVEPNPFTFSLLAKNAAANQGRIELLNFTLGGENGICRFLARTDQNGLSGVVNDRTTSVNPNDVEFISASVTLDTLVEKMGLDRIRAIKIDAEGSERAILSGAENIISKRVPDYIICEINRHELARNNTGEIEIRKIMEDAGYIATLLNGSGTDICGGSRIGKPYPLPEVVDTEIVFNIMFRRFDMEY
jgi:FkbM family methyltransferase